MAEHLRFNVDGKSIRMHAMELAPTAQQTHAALVLLHGAGGNLDLWSSRFAPFLNSAGVALYAPHYFDRTGTSYADIATITDGVHAPQWLATVDAAVRFVATRPGVDPARMILAGISLGAFLSLAFASQLSASNDALERARIRAVVEISGGLTEPYASQATSQFAPTLILHGIQDNVVPVSHATKLEQRLTDLNVAHRTELLEHEGHWFTPAALPRMLLAISSFLQEHTAPRPQQRAM